MAKEKRKTFGRPLGEEAEAPTFGRPLGEGAATKKKANPVKEFAKQSAIGGAQGALGTYGDLTSLVGLGSDTLLPGQEALYMAESEATSPWQLAALADDDLAPRYHRLPKGSDIERLFQDAGVSTEPEGAAGRYGRRIGRAGGGGVALGAPASVGGIRGILGAATLGQSVEEMFGPTAGTIAEVLALLMGQGVGRFSAKAALPKSQHGTYEAAKRTGLTDRELAPLLKGERVGPGLAKLAPKGRRSEAYAKELKDGFSRAYDSVKDRAKDLGPFDPGGQRHLVNEIGNVRRGLGKSLKGTDKAKVVQALADVERQIAQSPLGPAELIDYWQEINGSVNWRAVKGGKKALSKLKGPFGAMMKDSSPELFAEFSALNELYPRMLEVTKNLSPQQVNELFQKGTLYRSLYQLSKGDLVGMAKTLGGGRLAKEAAFAYLQSPRTVGLLKKMADFTNRGRLDQARAVAAQIDRELHKTGKEAEKKSASKGE